MSKLVDSVNLDSYQLFYKTMEHDHSYPNENLVRLEKWFLKKPGHVLDYGCGFGENLIFLTTRSYRVTGVDISSDLINYVRSKCRERGVPNHMFGLQTLENEESLPFEDESFDYIVSLGVLQYLGDRQSAAHCLKELTRCLRPGGKMIVSIFASENTFAIEGIRLGEERYYFKGTEKHKNLYLEYNLYIPKSAESFVSIFPRQCKVHEVGYWDNVYCGVKGKHYVALATKKK